MCIDRKSQNVSKWHEKQGNFPTYMLFNHSNAFSLSKTQNSPFGAPVDFTTKLDQTLLHHGF